MQADALADAVVLAIQSTLAPIVARVAALEARQLETPAAVAEQLAGLRERTAVLETRAPVPGPPGADGHDGAAGRDGVDGLGFDDLTAERRGDRTIAILATKAGQVRELAVLAFDWPIYRGVYEAGRTYDAGDVVTFGGSAWLAREPTTTRPETTAGAKAWTLAIKRGRDGRDLRAVS